MDFAAIPWRTTRYRGVRIHFYAVDQRSGRALVLIEMAPGHGYPRHRHRGAEEVLVVQGAYRDETGDHGAGQFVSYADGTVHTPVAVDGPQAESCVLLALAHEGISLLAGAN
ncbi:MAG TPA: cupin domain-containing protein [Planctomycetota bacterium]|nr:cupin domain-containing protein [Planctomycetota bacterium]